jgi:cell division transport system ATP-binding protein
MIRSENISLSYREGPPVLSDLSFSVEPGSFHFLTGPSGAGKTSLLSLLGLTHRVSAGKLELFDEDVTNLPREKLPLLRRRIGFVSQDFRLIEHLSVSENVALPLKVLNEDPEMIRAKVSELLTWVGLGEQGNALPETLSGGQKQRAAIARAVIAKPDLLLADEPTGNLDSQLALRFMYLFEALNQSGTTVVIATHDEQIIALFDYPVFRLEAGKIV